MPITLRTRPTCHYCGKRNGPSNNQYKFTCQYCQADNYFDESGQITDVPTSVVAPTQRYAVPVTPAFESANGSIFCATCLKNQYLYNAALSEYLPDPDHPEYEKFEAAIPAFKQDLERRYPTCCAICEPKVKAQLQQATYNARSDHVRRVLDRSRQRRNANQWGWRSLVVNAAGLGWLVSLLIQLCWHALGSQTHIEAKVLNVRPTECLTTWPVPPQCPQYLERFIGPSMLLGVLCIWWNPKWQHKLEGREGRLVGLDRFYKVQGMLLALRFASWVAITDVPNLASFRTMMHTVSLVLMMMVASWSRFRIIQIYIPRIVDWSQNPAPLLDSKQFIPPVPTQEVSPPSSQRDIPVNIFNTATTPAPQPWRPPTPPVDEDAMEWDPTPSTFSPAPKKAKYQSTEPTPFRGTLPAFSKGGIYRTKQETVTENPKAIGLPLGFFDKSHGKGLDTKQNPSSRDTGLAQPKFFPDIARTDTGLENIFDKVFSIQDEATLPAASSSVSVPNAGKASDHVKPHEQIPSAAEIARKAYTIYNVLMGIVLVVLIAVFLTQTHIDVSFLEGFSMRTVLQFVVMVPMLDIVFDMMLTSMGAMLQVSYLKVVLLTVEFCWLIYLRGVRSDVPRVIELWQKLVTASFTVLIAQRFIYVSAHYSPVWQPPAHIETEDKAKDIMPAVVSNVQPQPATAIAQTLRRSSSDESMASTASIATTSTASGWKTPVKNHREEFRSEASSSSYGMSGLSFKDDNNFGSGNSVAGPRTRRTPARGGKRAW